MTSLAELVTYRLPDAAPLPAVADPAFDRIASLVTRSLDTPISLVSLVDRNGEVTPGQAGLDLSDCDSRSTPLAASICKHVVGSGSALVVSDARSHLLLASNPTVMAGDVVAYAGVPLMDMSGSTVGSLSAIDTSPRFWSPGEMDLLCDLALTCSTELQLRESAKSAHEANEHSAVLLELSEALSDKVTICDISHAVGALAVHHLGGACGDIITLDRATHMLHYVNPATLPGAELDRTPFPLTRPTPAADAARERRSLFFANLDCLAAVHPDAAATLATTGMASAAYLPLLTADRVLGTLVIGWNVPKSFPLHEQALLNGLARYTAQAVERAMLLEERRDVAHTLQAEMLPVLPEVDWLELSGHYLAAGESDEIGGDWFDAFQVSEQELVLSVGDVQGHDTRAAAIMGRLSSTLRRVVANRPETPSDVLTAVDRVHSTASPARFATALFGTMRRDEHCDTFTWSNAGHMPALLLAPGQPPSLLPSVIDQPLGVRHGDGPRHSQSVTVPVGSTLLLFTDGLVERRGGTIDARLEELAETAERNRDLPLPAMTAAIMSAMAGDGHNDDVVLLGVRNPPSTPIRFVPVRNH